MVAGLRWGCLVVLMGLALPACAEPAPPEPVSPAPSSTPSQMDLAGLGDADPAVRLATVRAVAETTTPVHAEVEDVRRLAETLADENRWVREWTARALRRLGPAAAPAVAELTTALRDRDSFVRWRAAEALAAIGPAARDALPVLEESAAETDETELGRHWAAEAIRRIRGE